MLSFASQKCTQTSRCDSTSAQCCFLGQLSCSTSCCQLLLGATAALSSSSHYCTASCTGVPWTRPCRGQCQYCMILCPGCRLLLGHSNQASTCAICATNCHCLQVACVALLALLAITCAAAAKEYDWQVPKKECALTDQKECPTNLPRGGCCIDDICQVGADQ